LCGYDFYLFTILASQSLNTGVALKAMERKKRERGHRENKESATYLSPVELNNMR